MSSASAADTASPRPSVFLSYASEDRDAARALRDALPSFGLEVWYDESALDGGDAWDQKIRRQIRQCDFFMPLISARTELRPEGYFRREWRLAVERTLDMADDHPFLLPVVIDDTPEAGARVPEKFLTVQWMRVPGGKPTPALEARCRRLVSGQGAHEQPARNAPPAPAGTARAAGRSRVYPEFPRAEAGQTLRFWAEVCGWALQSAWIFFSSLPKWVRILVYLWLFILLLSRACVPSHQHSARIPPASADKLTKLADGEPASAPDETQLATQIARAVADGTAGLRPASPLLAIPFGAPAGDAAARQLADASFTQIYGKVAISQHGHVGLLSEPLSAPDMSAALARGRAHQARYVLFGAVDGSSPPSLVVEIVAVADGALLWSKSYPLSGADPSGIAADVDARVQSLDLH